MSFAVYFNAREVNGKWYLGVVVYEMADKFPPIIVEKEKIQGATFYEAELEAFRLALEVIKDEEYSDVVLYNQNRLIFEWLKQDTHENRLRATYYTHIRELFKDIVGMGITIGYEVIRGNQNEAGKALREFTKELGEVQDLTGLFGGGTVVDLNKRRKIN